MGYAIQWPIFGIFFVVAYRKYIQYEKERLLGDEAPAAPTLPTDEITEVPEDFLQAEERAEETEDIWVDDRRKRARMRASKNNERKNNDQKGH